MARMGASVRCSRPHRDDVLDSVANLFPGGAKRLGGFLPRMRTAQTGGSGAKKTLALCAPLRDDAGYNDDECASRTADLYARSAQGGNGETRDDGRARPLPSPKLALNATVPRLFIAKFNGNPKKEMTLPPMVSPSLAIAVKGVNMPGTSPKGLARAATTDVAGYHLPNLRPRTRNPNSGADSLPAVSTGGHSDACSTLPARAPIFWYSSTLRTFCSSRLPGQLCYAACLAES
jgi:hypothetical protein